MSPPTPSLDTTMSRWSLSFRGELEQEIDFIQKPFTAETLVRKVRMTLDREGLTSHHKSDT